LKEGSIDIDFNQMTKRDSRDGTKFEVGGRMFFEAHVFGDSYTSFTTNAFLDKEGYVEPQIKKTVSSVFLDNWYWFTILFIFIGTGAYYFCKSQ
jgi:hypothetical protein